MVIFFQNDFELALGLSLEIKKRFFFHLRIRKEKILDLWDEKAKACGCWRLGVPCLIGCFAFPVLQWPALASSDPQIEIRDLQHQLLIVSFATIMDPWWSVCPLGVF